MLHIQFEAVVFDAGSQSYFVYYNGCAEGYPARERVTINLAVFPVAELAKLPLRPAR